jgi:hypothetical protein
MLILIKCQPAGFVLLPIILSLYLSQVNALSSYKSVALG